MSRGGGVVRAAELSGRLRDSNRVHIPPPAFVLIFSFISRVNNITLAIHERMDTRSHVGFCYPIPEILTFPMMYKFRNLKEETELLDAPQHTTVFLSIEDLTSFRNSCDGFKPRPGMEVWPYLLKNRPDFGDNDPIYAKTAGVNHECGGGRESGWICSLLCGWQNNRKPEMYDKPADIGDRVLMTIQATPRENYQRIYRVVR